MPGLKLRSTLAFLIICTIINAQYTSQNDTINGENINQVTVTATRSNSPLKNIAGKVDIIGQNQIENLPLQKIDDIFRFTSGVNVNRSYGNYTMRPVVTLRNLGGDEQGRTLVLMNGVPINISDEGGVNWNRINPNNILKVEVLKGPGSSIYGNNAMGGVINIITCQAVKPFEASLGTSYGTFNTFKPEMNLGGNIRNKLIWSISGFYQTSDGYNPVPKSKPEYNYSIARFLKEGGISSNIDYKVNKLINIGVQFDLCRDKRGEGVKIKAPDGEFRTFNTNFSQLKFSGQKENFEYQVNIYYQREHYYRIDERMKGKGNVYSRFDAESNRDDNGMIVNTNYSFTNNHRISLGLEYKNGSVDGGDYYKTSTDYVLNKGTLTSSAAYIQEELKLLSERLNTIASLRIDKVKFQNGSFIASGTNVDYWTLFTPKLSNHSWNAISPRIAMRYQLLRNSSIYMSYSKGFRASNLDDLCRSGYMWVGPKIANPNLGPEYLDNYEIGMNVGLFEKLIIEPTFYYSIGNDFLYYVANGDSIFNLPVYKRENITKVVIKGAEIDIKYSFTSNLNIWANYSFGTSHISEFKKQTDLEGKSLKYSPKHQGSIGFIWTNKTVNTGFGVFYKDKQFSNDKNSTTIPGYFTVDFQLSRSFLDNFKVAFQVQDLFNNRHMEIIDYLSPGRLLTLSIKYQLTK